jgi:hypothetical protein
MAVPRESSQRKPRKARNYFSLCATGHVKILVVRGFLRGSANGSRTRLTWMRTMCPSR